MGNTYYQEMLDVFFEAMLGGYANGIEGKPVPNMPGARYIASKFGYWKVTDTWMINNVSNKSSGMTAIFHHRAPVWSMSYEGKYPVRARPFLKAVLEKTYREKQFAGCRGANFTEGLGSLRYTNVFSGGFTDFNGTEQITKRKRDGVILLGYHKYRGGTLV